MGLFGNSNTVNEIHREIGCINDYLRKMESCVNKHGGINLNNSEQIADYFVKTLKHQEQVQSLLNMLSEREQSKLSLCWMDGRYFPLYMWNGSYLMVMNQVKRELDKIIDKLGI